MVWWADVRCTLRICKGSRPEASNSLKAAFFTPASRFPARDWVRAPGPCHRMRGLVA
jgi:hypothetical protein